MHADLQRIRTRPPIVVTTSVAVKLVSAVPGVYAPPAYRPSVATPRGIIVGFRG
jgi:hypothetical protein